jgi:hypothetical protein
MKKTILLSCLLLVLLVSVLPAPPQDKAEKLRYEDNGWEKDGQQFVIQMSCKFGQATAGEHADFKVRTILDIFKHDGQEWDSVTGERSIRKLAGAEKDADHYVKIEPTTIAWDRQGYIGNVSVTASLQLIGPSGNTIGDAVVTPPTMIVIWPDSPVKMDENGWDYDPEKDAIVVPLLAHSGIVDIITKGYQVKVDVDVWNLDGSVAGSGEGSAAIVKIDGQGGEYVQIQPALAVLDDGVSWNGDDDGNGIVSGTITLVSNGTVHSITTFEKQEVGFVIHEPLPGH